MKPCILRDPHLRRAVQRVFFNYGGRKCKFTEQHALNLNLITGVPQEIMYYYYYYYYFIFEF
jgi:hypothetical protein